MSEDLLTAVAEYEQDLGIRPGTFCAYEIDVDGVVDLTDGRVRAICGVTQAILACSWKTIALVLRQRPPTWDLADRLFSQGAAGVRVASVQNPIGVNLVLWRWGDAPERSVIAHDPHGELPRDRSSWRS